MRTGNAWMAWVLGVCVTGATSILWATDDAPLADDDALEAVAVEAAPEEALEEEALEMPEGMDPEEWARQEEIRRQEREIQGLRELEKGLDLLRRRDYTAATRSFDAALRLIPDRPATQDDRRRAHWGAAESAFARARELFAVEDSDLSEVRRLNNRVLAHDPNHRGAQRLSRRIDREAERRAEVAARPVPAKDRPMVVERRKSTRELLAEGKDFYSIGDYNAAVAIFERVLQLDEYNRDAMRFLKKIEEERYEISTLHRDMTVARAMQQVRDGWSTPILQEVQLPDEVGMQPTIDARTATEQTRQKMESIIIPSIEFRQADIRDVINFLVDASIAGDPDREGVNIILNLQAPGEAAPREGLEPERRPRRTMDDDFSFDDFMEAPERAPTPRAAPRDAPARSGDIPSITLNLRRISMLDALKIITEVAGLRYRIDGRVVIVTPAHMVSGTVVTRMYPVQPTLLDVIIEREADDRRDRTGEFVEMGRTTTQVTRADVREFFQRAGVPFPVGTSITYNPGISTLIVSNTPENLEMFERILAQLNVIPNQVEIEARFVELRHDNLKAAGLEWILASDWDLARRKGNQPLSNTERIQVDSDQDGFTKGMRYFQIGGTGVEPGTSIASVGGSAGSILSFTSILTNPELNVVLHALDQHGGSDLLSAPRVTTRSGVNAQIQVVTEIIYPTEFEVTEPVIHDTAGGGVVSPPTVTPMHFETREVGVILNVTPTVGPDGYTIDLTMVPEVSELVDWIQYGSTSVMGGNVFNFNIPQPVFNSRHVTTSIVIWDGQTVVMGGLIREEMITFEDKIPLLGDIPLLGRLFRSEGKQSQKSNLLIFVTARLVDPAGQPIHKVDPMTMPGEAALMAQ